MVVQDIDRILIKLIRPEDRLEIIWLTPADVLRFRQLRISRWFSEVQEFPRLKICEACASSIEFSGRRESAVKLSQNLTSFLNRILSFSSDPARLSSFRTDLVSPNFVVVLLVGLWNSTSQLVVQCLLCRAQNLKLCSHLQDRTAELNFVLRNFSNLFEWIEFAHFDQRSCDFVAKRSRLQGFWRLIYE